MTPSEQSIPCICGNIDCAIPYGTCHCGCGEITRVATRNRYDVGHRKGMPVPYMQSHWMRIPREEFGEFKIDGATCRLVKLTMGQYAIVNDSEYERVMKSIWSALKRKNRDGFYAVTSKKNADGKVRLVYMHRFILGLESGDPREGDHREPMTTLDNRIENLRIASSAQNSMNSHTQQRRKGKLKGAHRHKAHWVSQITFQRKMIILGRFKTELEAHLRYCEEAKKLFGEFARFK